jgi:F-type H+-transporting ATPase subunit gamma
MTERLANINARIAGIRQVGAVVNAMRGIAGARAQAARIQLAAVDRYAATIAAAIGQALLMAPMPTSNAPRASRMAVVVFCAEQGFAGAFSEHVLGALPGMSDVTEILLVGTRGRAAAAERGMRVGWTAAMPSHSAGIPKLADRIVEAVYARIGAGSIDSLAAVFSRWQPGYGVRVERGILFPLDLAGFPHPRDGNKPLANLPPEILLRDLTADYVHAQLCKAALHAFSAENEARMAVMAGAHGKIDQKLAALKLVQCVLRQEEITAEIAELSAGEIANET